ncbi:MAG: ankyrin repeat domain-containing protein [Oscillospiraceae bacterium]|jgi:ankyrin repeat protein|nr:ankyrin repeat domain-containing protein [Oscillospiraceae bacterium]
MLNRFFKLSSVAICACFITYALCGCTSNESYAKKVVQAIENNDDAKLDKLLESKSGNLNSVTQGDLFSALTESSGYTPLQYACYTGKDGAVKKLIEHGADVNYVTNRSANKSPLICAMECKEDSNLEIAKLLIDKGADVNYTQKIGGVECYNALMALEDTEFDSIISDKRHTPNAVKLLEMLESSGVDIYKDNMGIGDILYRSCLHGNSYFIRFLIEQKDFNVNSNKNREKQTPLIAFTEQFDEYHTTDDLKYLLSCGANPNLKDIYGKTAYDYAKENGNKAFMQILDEST